MRVWVKLWVGLLGAIPSKLLKRMAGTTGLEPAASAVTGQRSNQLNYVPTRQINDARPVSGFEPIQVRLINVKSAPQRWHCGRTLNESRMQELLIYLSSFCRNVKVRPMFASDKPSINFIFRRAARDEFSNLRTIGRNGSTQHRAQRSA